MSKDALQRAARTFLQTFLGIFISLTILPHAAPGTIPTWDTLKVAGLAALWGAVSAVLALLQNLLEDKTAFPILFGKAPAIVVAKQAPDAPDVHVIVQQVLPEATTAEVGRIVAAQVHDALVQAAAGTAPVVVTPQEPVVPAQQAPTLDQL